MLPLVPLDFGASRSSPQGSDRQPASRLWHRAATFPNVSRRQARALSDSLSPSPAVAATAVTTTSPALLEAGGAIDRLFAAGLEWHLGRLSAARAGRREHLTPRATATRRVSPSATTIGCRRAVAPDGRPAA